MDFVDPSPYSPLHKSARCEELANPSIFNFVVSLIILIGILVSYLPQHHRIIKLRSSEGLSAYFVLLGTTSGTCAIANILVLPTSREDVSCCTVNSAFSCAAGLLGIAQVSVQWTCFFVIMLLFLTFIPRNRLERHVINGPLVPMDSAYRGAVMVVVVSILHFIVTFFICILMLAIFPDHLQIWANVLGTTSSVVASVQYIPQIWTTWRRQSIGSLSIPMMLIQTPGSFVFAASLAYRLGTKGWSAWIVYIVTGSLQASLLTMSIMFVLRDRRLANEPTTQLPDDMPEDRVDDDDGDETDPLLQHERLVERQRQRALDRRLSNPLTARLMQNTGSTSSGSPPDDLVIDKAAAEAEASEHRSIFAHVASRMRAPFRQSSHQSNARDSLVGHASTEDGELAPEYHDYGTSEERDKEGFDERKPQKVELNFIRIAETSYGLIDLSVGVGS